MEVPVRKLFDEFVKAGIGQPLSPEMYLTFNEGRIFQEDTFADNRKKNSGLGEAELKRSLLDCLCIVTELTNLSVNELQSSGKRTELSNARGVLALLVREYSGASLKCLSNLLCKDTATLSRLANKMAIQEKENVELAFMMKEARSRITLGS